MTPIYHYDLEQRSDDWHEIRKGRFTGTDAALFLVNGTNDSGLGSGVLSALYYKAAELIADYTPQQFDKFALIQGREREPEAVAIYEETIYPETVTPCGFVELGQYFGYSPDRLISDNGSLEVKCPQPPEYLRYMMSREIDKAYIAQMQWGLWITGRAWCDFVVYNPDFGDCPKVITRIGRDEKMMSLFTQKASAVHVAMDEILFKYETLSV